MVELDSQRPMKVVQANDNILKLLQRKPGFGIPSDWEALGFILGQIRHHSFLHHLDVPVDDFEEVIMFSENNGRCNVTILRSSFIPAELEDIIASGHPMSYFVRWSRVSQAPRQQKGRFMSIEEIQAIARNSIIRLYLHMMEAPFKPPCLIDSRICNYQQDVRNDV